jgi:hypothetical protein
LDATTGSTTWCTTSGATPPIDSAVYAEPITVDAIEIVRAVAVADRHTPSSVSSTMGYTHLVTANDVRVAGELGALLDKGFCAQDLPEFPPNGETASESQSEAD